MTNYSALRRPLSDRLPIVTYTNRYSPTVETLWMSPQAERLTGYSLDEWVARPGFFQTILHPDDRAPVVEEMRASRAEGRAFSRDYRLLRRDGGVIWIHDESVPIADESGDPELIQGFFVDISERKELERQLLHAQKLEAVGRFAAGIAHDFNNLLMAISGHASLALRGLPEGSTAKRHLTELLATVESASRLTRQLLLFGRTESLAPALVDLRGIVEAARPMLRRVAGDWVRLELDLQETPTIHADPGQLEQVLVNLVANARDGHAGSITIRTGGDNQAVRLTVIDDGEGMDEATCERALDPFFTTKAGEGGSGLGLSIVDGIVRGAGGTLEIESAPLRGTTVAIRLPAAILG
ncbi:MAG TPA: ATP-binding protein [Gaiellaceae bacterium]|nr:ATP-binding protein [Gaiellaceae bacterium]